MEPVYASGYGEKQKLSRSMPKAAAYVKYFAERRDELGADRTEEQFEQLRIEASEKLAQVPENELRAKVILSWSCCRGTIFVEKIWRLMLWILFLVLKRAGIKFVFPVIFRAFYGLPLRLARKKMGDVECAREHSFGFQQARNFMAELGFQWYIYSVHGIRLPYVPYGELLLKVEVLETRAQYPGIIRFDGPLVRKVNAILKKMGGRKECRLTAEVLIVCVFNFVIGDAELRSQVTTESIWSSCHFGSDSQGKYLLLKDLVRSFEAASLDDETVGTILASRDVDELADGELARLKERFESDAIQHKLDAGYPDARIKETSDINKKSRRKQRTDLERLFEWAGWA